MPFGSSLFFMFTSQNLYFKMQIAENVSTSLNHCISPRHSSIFSQTPHTVWGELLVLAGHGWKQGFNI